MSDANICRTVMKRVLPASRAEWIIAMVIVVFLVALLMSPTRWAADGAIEVPVRVFVYDPSNMSPIAGATVIMFRTSPLTGGPSRDEIRERFPFEKRSRDESGLRTGVDGTVDIDVRFATVASDRNPESRVHIDSYWIMAAAEGYQTATVPLRSSATPTKSLRERGELPVNIGLLPKVAGE